MSRFCFRVTLIVLFVGVFTLPGRADSTSVSVEASPNQTTEVATRSEPSVCRWTKDAPDCLFLYRNGAPVKALTTKMFFVSCSLACTPHYTVATIRAQNNSGKPVNLVPETCLLLSANTTYSPLNVDGLSNSAARSNQAWEYVGGKRHAYVDSSDGDGNYTGGNTVTYGDGRGGLLGLVANSMATKGVRKRSELEPFRRLALRANTLLPGENIEGVLLFPRKAWSPDAVLKLALGSQQIEI